jgi:hypothetical protein
MKIHTAFNYLEVSLTTPKSFWNDSLGYKYGIAKDLVQSLASPIEGNLSEVPQSNCT